MEISNIFIVQLNILFHLLNLIKLFDRNIAKRNYQINKYKIIKMYEEKKQNFDKIYNIKGLSWMLKMHQGTSTVSSTNSSHIDQQFKIFKLKDEKRKWKKKINKKFQTVGLQIQNIIKAKYQTHEPFAINYKKQPNLKYTPHLKEIKNIYAACDQQTQAKAQKHLKLYEAAQQQSNQRAVSQNDEEMEASLPLPLKDLSNLFVRSNQISSKQLPKRKSVESIKYQSNQQNQVEIFNLKKLLAATKNENNKVIKTKNLLEIHQKQKILINKENANFFKRQTDWIDNKIVFYQDFDIKKYETELIHKKCANKI